MCAMLILPILLFIKCTTLKKLTGYEILPFISANSRCSIYKLLIYSSESWASCKTRFKPQIYTQENITVAFHSYDEVNRLILHFDKGFSVLNFHLSSVFLLRTVCCPLFVFWYIFWVCMPSYCSHSKISFCSYCKNK